MNHPGLGGRIEPPRGGKALRTLGRVWSFVWRVRSVGGLREWIGGREAVGAAMIAIALSALARILDLPGPAVIGIALIGFTVVLVLWSAILQSLEKAPDRGTLPTTHPADHLTLLRVDFDFNYAMWADPEHPAAIMPVFSSDCDFPVEIRVVRWTSTSYKISARMKGDTLQAKTNRPVDQYDWNPVEGADTLVVQPQEVFRARIAIKPVELADLEKLRAAQRLGAITLTVDNVEIAFDL